MAWKNAEVDHFDIVDKNYEVGVVIFYKQNECRLRYYNRLKFKISTGIIESKT